MKKRTRRIIFYIGVVAFIFLSYVATMYARGYKYSYSDNKFILTGAISVKSNTESKVFLNDKLRGYTSFIGNNFGISRLLPDQYNLRLEREGYSPWQKKVGVQEGRVTDFPRILLVDQSEENISVLKESIAKSFLSERYVIGTKDEPKKDNRTKPIVSISPSPSVGPRTSYSDFVFISGGTIYLSEGSLCTPIAEGVNGFSVSENNSKISFWNNHEIWVYWLTDTSYQPYMKKDQKALITRFASRISGVVWFEGNDHLVADAEGLKIIETDTRGGINIIKL